MRLRHARQAATDTSRSRSVRVNCSPPSIAFSLREFRTLRDPPLILAVDDTPENLEILMVRLEANSYVVKTAADGEEGLRLVRELKPDLVLLDIMMPKLDGIAVVRELKTDPVLCTIPVILVTA